MTEKQALETVDKILFDGEFIHYGFIITPESQDVLSAAAESGKPISAFVTFDEENFQLLLPSVASIARSSGRHIAVVGSDKRPVHSGIERVFSDAQIIDYFDLEY